MADARRATEAERRRYGVAWRITGSQRTQLPASSYTGWDACQERMITRAEQMRRHCVDILGRYARALGVSRDEARQRVMAQGGDWQT